MFVLTVEVSVSGSDFYSHLKFHTGSIIFFFSYFQIRGIFLKDGPWSRSFEE